MVENYTYTRPKTPDILKVPFVEDIHPYTMMFLYLSYQQGAYENLTDIQRLIFDRYFTGPLTITGQKEENIRKLESEIADGFQRLRSNVTEELVEAFPGKLLPYFKKSDILVLQDFEKERKKFRSANTSKSMKGIKRSREHVEIMRRNKKAFWQDPEKKSKTILAMKKAASDPKVKRRQREAQKIKWEDPEYRKRVSEGLKKAKKDGVTPETIERLKKSAKRRWQDPANRQAQSQRLKEVYSDPLRRQELSKAMVERWKDPEYRQRFLEGRRKSIERKKREEAEKQDQE